MYRLSIGLTALSLLFAAPWVSAQNGADRILGVYKMVGEKSGITSHIQFFRSGDAYDARVIWLDCTSDEKGKPLTDNLNPDPELRNVRVDQVQVVTGVKYNPKNEDWSGGTIYNPVDGKTYDVTICFNDASTLKVRGYIGKPLIGKDFLWHRIK